MNKLLWVTESSTSEVREARSPTGNCRIKLSDTRRTVIRNRCELERVKREGLCVREWREDVEEMCGGKVWGERMCILYLSTSPKQTWMKEVQWVGCVSNTIFEDWSDILKIWVWVGCECEYKCESARARMSGSGSGSMSVGGWIWVWVWMCVSALVICVVCASTCIPFAWWPFVSFFQRPISIFIKIVHTKKPAYNYLLFLFNN